MDDKAINCDGCGISQELEQFHFVKDYDHECRYCSPCREAYVDLVRASTAQEQLLQRQLAEWMLWARQRVPLKLTPFDLAKSRPEIKKQATEAGVVLG